MSVARTVKLKYNLERLKQAAELAGFATTGTLPETLVINGLGGRSGIQFKRVNDNEISVHADFDGGRIQRDMSERILPRYVELMLQAQGRGFRVLNQTSANNKVVLTVGRS